MTSEVPLAGSINAALVHDWLPVFSGAEMVVAQILSNIGPSDLFTLYDFLSDEDRERLGAARIFTSSLNSIPMAKRFYRWTFPLCPTAIESFDLSAYDLVISSSAAFAKGVITHPQQRHIAYVHTPMRYAWDQTFEYQSSTRFARFPANLLLQRELHNLRIWDARTAHGPDLMVANSNLVKRRIEQIYGRNSLVIHPPVDIERFPICREKDDYFVLASRLVPYKRVDLVVDAFKRMPDRRLIVLGDGPEMRTLKNRASANVMFEGHVPRSVLIERIRRARAFIFASYEDFGIAMAEAQAAGTPVISYSRGGARDIIVPLGKPTPTGHFFHVQSVEAVIDAVDQFCEHEAEIDFDACHENALRFSKEVFDRKFSNAIHWTLDHRGKRDDWSRDLEEFSAIENGPSRKIRKLS